MVRYFFFCLLISGFLTSCTSQMASNMHDNRQEMLAFELQSELSELKRQVNGHHVDLQILEEKLAKSSTQNSSMALLERKIAELEKLQNKIVSDLRELSSHAHQTFSSLKQYGEKIQSCESQVAEIREKLGEVVKIKSTLSSISKAMGNATSSAKAYKVRSGDSLEKIARNHNTTIEELKKINSLNHDTIMIGQELKIPQ